MIKVHPVNLTYREFDVGGGNRQDMPHKIAIVETGKYVTFIHVLKRELVSEFVCKNHIPAEDIRVEIDENVSSTAICSDGCLSVWFHNLIDNVDINGIGPRHPRIP
jgi:hypothetical protein